jgi:NCS1 family nucleobase:cation symporter-1
MQPAARRGIEVGLGDEDGSSMTAASASGQTSAIEVHSIDYIPQKERHGNVSNQATLWFLGNAELATLVVGFIGISLGLNLFWCLVAIILGEVFGTFFMAFHSVQGPRLGIPQLIQSRPQFGYYGALIPQAIGVFLYVGFNVFNTIISGLALSTVLPGIPSQVSIPLMAALALVLTLGGYDWIHFVQKWGTYIFLPVFGVFTVGVILTAKLPAEQLSTAGFQLTPFLVVLIVVAAYQVSQAPYVSDYSRYLNKEISAKSTFWWTYFGSSIGSLWMIALGGLLLAAYPKAGQVDSIVSGGNAIFNGFGTFTLAIALIGLVSVIALNLYSGSLAGLAAVDTVSPIKATLNKRIAAVVVIAILGTGGALLIPSDFLAGYNNFLVVLIYFLTPWTAVNLVDFYFIRKGDYAIREIFNPRGIYGRWNWRGLVAYFAGFAVMIPFFSITNFFVGPVAKAAGGADFSIFIGLPFSALLYYLLARGQDLSAERRLAAADDATLEGMAAPMPAYGG